MRRLLSYGFLRLLGLLLAVILFVSCNDDSEGQSASGVTDTYKVLMIVPETQQKICDRTTAWALDNIAKAQQGLQRKVKLELVWKNEYDADLASYVRTVAGAPDYVAIIGPTESGYASTVAPICTSAGKPLILPIATSTELQRKYAGSGTVWNMVQSDITQCELLLSQAELSEIERVQLITSDDDYGKSFSDWFAFQALELGLAVDGVTIYSDESELSAAVKAQANVKRVGSKAIIFAPSKESDAVCFDTAIGEMKAARGNKSFEFPLLLCSDIMSTASLGSKLKNMQYEGVAPTANPETGFLSAYKLKFGEEPVNGEAHIYDALMLTAYALAAKTDGETLNDAILRVVDGRETCHCSWMPADMHNAFAMLRNGQTPNLEGVTGDWTFDAKTHASVLNTTYNHWILSNGTYQTIEYLSTDGSGRTTSTMQLWDNPTTVKQSFSDDQPDYAYSDLRNKWAVVVATSDTWGNYRHQADALAMYQLLKRHGYDDDHIILIMEDNIANNPKNIYPGKVFTHSGGDNIYYDVHVDYHLSDIDIRDLKQIMLGEKSSSLPNIISSTANDNVIVFWCGHGNKNTLEWGSNKDISGDDVTGILQAMSEQQKYRKLMFVIDACYSGTIGRACEGIPGVLSMCASNAYEKSHAVDKDPVMQVYLSNYFTRAFQEQIDEDPTISLRDLYFVLARRTLGSHATVYNAEHYGNLYRNSMAEFLEP